MSDEASSSDTAPASGLALLLRVLIVMIIVPGVVMYIISLVAR